MDKREIFSRILGSLKLFFETRKMSSKKEKEIEEKMI